jgi:hypothetical protein
MPDDRKLALTELLTFLENYSLRETIVDNKPLKALVRSLYKRHHALLVWHVNLEQREIWEGNTTKDTAFRQHLKESTSDVCQSILVFSQGLYKPSYLMLRSAVENFLKCVAIAENQAVLSLTSVFDLMAVVKDTPAISGSANLRTSFRNLRRIYAELCSYVHSSDHEFMSLTAYLGEYPGFDNIKSADYVKSCRSAIVSMCSMLTLLFPTRLREFHHRDLDFVADILPKNVKHELHT